MIINRKYNTMLTRQLTLNVSVSFEVPFVYLKHNIQEIEEALLLGSMVQSSVKTIRSTEEVKKIIEVKNLEIQRIESSYQEKLTKLLDDIKSLADEKNTIQNEYMDRIKDAQHNEKQQVSKEYNEQLRTLQNSYEILSSKYNGLEASKRILEESRSKDIQEAIQRTETMMDKIVASKQEQIIKMESAYNKLQESIQKQSEEVIKLSNLLGKRNSNVKLKGSDFEEMFGNKLKKYYGLCKGFYMNQTHLGSGHQMDFLIGIEGHNILWELKNYSTVVPKPEIDKFLRDLKENPQAQIGILISRTTDIYNKNQSSLLVTEFYEDKMIIYINRFEEFCDNNESLVFEMLLSLFRIWWNYHHDEKNSFDRVELILEIEKTVDELSKRRTEWKRHKLHLEETSRWIQNLLDDTELRLDRLLKKARNNDEKESEHSVIYVIPDNVFRELKEEKDIQFAQSIMKVCSLNGEIEVRELVDLLTAHHKLSKDTLRSNIMSIVKDSAIIKKGVIKLIKGISKFVPECKIQLPVSK
jgi:hypothetical protein